MINYTTLAVEEAEERIKYLEAIVAEQEKQIQRQARTIEARDITIERKEAATRALLNKLKKGVI